MVKCFRRHLNNNGFRDCVVTVYEAVHHGFSQSIITIRGDVYAKISLHPFPAWHDTAKQLLYPFREVHQAVVV